MKRIIVPVLMLFCMVSILHPVKAVVAGNIDPAQDGHKYAYGENVGWVNLEPSLGPGVTVEDNRLAGYIWSENIGWINLSPSYGGISHDSKGNLSGYGWSENTGWINFSCATGIIGTCSSVDFGVKIDTITGAFSGYAWGENIGWIKFDYGGYPANHALTSWRMNGDISSDGLVTLADAIITLQVMTGTSPASPVHSGADIGTDSRIGLEEAVYILQDIAARHQVE